MRGKPFTSLLPKCTTAAIRLLFPNSETYANAFLPRSSKSVLYSDSEIKSLIRKFSIIIRRSILSFELLDVWFNGIKNKIEKNEHLASDLINHTFVQKMLTHKLRFHQMCTVILLVLCRISLLGGTSLGRT